MNIVVVEPFHTGSHRAWAEGYARHSTHDVRLVTHPGRWWKWRMRGSAVTLAESLSELEDWVPDLLLVSDMIDLAQFRTFSRRFIGDVPTVLYFHESQFTYPTPESTTPDVSYALTNWLSAYAADYVLFNSEYHRQVFFDSLPGLLRQFPDMTHERLIDRVAARSEVLPVGVDLSWIGDRPDSGEVPRVLWNHRWEFDKDPDTFADAIDELTHAGVVFELALLGHRPGRTPAALARIRDVAHDRLAYDGEAPRDVYEELVATCDIVVSTSMQEFFGISVVEAVAAGCRPVLPDRLSYPGLIPEEYHDAVLYQDGDIAKGLLRAINDPRTPDGLAASMMRFSWEAMAPCYDQRLRDLSQI